MDLAFVKRVAGIPATLLILFAAVSLVPDLQGCRTVSSAPRTLINASPSPEDLSRRFIAALAADDLEGAKALRITKDEFCTYVFPELPASKTPNVTCDFVWSQATLNSMAGMSRMLDGHKGAHFEFVSVRPSAVENYKTYRVLKAPVVTVKDAAGATQELRLFGSMLELDGQYKLFSFVVD